MRKLIKVGLTGGICSGKSTISLMLKESGFKVIDADEIAKEVLSKYPEILEEVRLTFGGTFFDWRGNFRRREFGNHIFRFQKERLKYEAIIMPYIKKEIDEAFKLYEKDGEKLVVLDGATLIENGYHKELDMMVLVWVNLQTQIERLKFRDKLTQNEAVNRINAQWSLEKKKKFVNLVIDNNNNIIKTKEQVDDFIELLNLYKK